MASPMLQRKNVRKGSSGQNIKVFVRCRPMNTAEKNSKSFAAVECQHNREIVVRERPVDKFSKTFTFDRVFGPDSKQVDVYKAVAKNSVDEVLCGFNCTIFAYGQTGTGKTFTMEGEHTSENMSWDEDPLLGIIPRCVNHLFDELRMQKVEFTMRVSFLELYNEELFDLLSAHDDLSKLRLYEDSSRKGSCIIQGLEEVLVRSKLDVYNVLQKGSSKRQTAATLMNAHSSRSHTVFTVTVHIKENTVDGDELLKTGKLHLVDLAGSENIGRSGAVEKRAREAGNINMSLLTLGRVITSLVEKAPHVPYRESKLTRLLQDALGGRTKTSIIATVSPSSLNLEESLSTLDYAHRAKNIQNKPEVNQKLNKKELIGEYSEEIERLRRDLMAMREKSGVYLANENFQEMTTTIETQAQEITEKIGYIRALSEELEKIKELFTGVSSQLEETQEKLDTTKVTLTCTQQLLHDTSQKLDEQKYLVTEHSKTEDKLKGQGKALIDHALVTTDDLSKLYDKLDRKITVDDKNVEITKSFEESYIKHVATMKASLSSTVSQQKEAIHSISSQFDGSIKKCKEEVLQISAHLQTIAENQKDLVNNLHGMFKEKVQADLSATKAMSAQLTEQCVQQESQLNTFQKEEILPSLDKIATLISSHANTVNDLSDLLTSKLNELHSECEKSQQSQEKLANDFEEDMNSHLEAHAARTVTCLNNANALREKVDSTAECIATKINSLEQQLADLKQFSEELTTTASAGLSNMSSDLGLMKEETQTTNDNVKTLVKSLCENNQSHVSATHAIQTEAKDSMEKYVNELENNMQRLGEERCSLESQVAQYATRTMASVQETRTAAQNHVAEVEAKSSQDITDHFGRIEMALAFTNDIESKNKMLEAEVSELEKECANIQKECQATSKTLDDWSNSYLDGLSASEMQVLELFTEKMLKDVPTGLTPVRRDYPFSKFLSTTSPHERLLERFRSGTATRMSKIPLPSFDDTEDELGSSSADVSQLSASESSQLEDEEMGIRSRSGSVSSSKADSGVFVAPAPPQRQESKEDLPLSRSSSTTSIPEQKDKENSIGRRGSKKRELKQPGTFGHLEKSGSNDSLTSRGRRVLGTQN